MPQCSVGKVCLSSIPRQTKGSHVPFCGTGVPCPCRVASGSQDRPTKQYHRAYSYLGKGDEGGRFLIIVLALNQGAPDIHQRWGPSVESKVSLLMAEKAQGAIKVSEERRGGEVCAWEGEWFCFSLLFHWRETNLGGSESSLDIQGQSVAWSKKVGRGEAQVHILAWERGWFLQKTGHLGVAVCADYGEWLWVIRAVAPAVFVQCCQVT